MIFYLIESIWRIAITLTLNHIFIFFWTAGGPYLQGLLRLKTLYFAYCINEMVGRFNWEILPLTILLDATEC
jgi:hypothetical protein